MADWMAYQFQAIANSCTTVGISTNENTSSSERGIV
jgi:hypothetical protein